MTLYRFAVVAVVAPLTLVLLTLSSPVLGQNITDSPSPAPAEGSPEPTPGPVDIPPPDPLPAPVDGATLGPTPGPVGIPTPDPSPAPVDGATLEPTPGPVDITSPAPSPAPVGDLLPTLFPPVPGTPAPSLAPVDLGETPLPTPGPTPAAGEITGAPTPEPSPAPVLSSTLEPTAPPTLLAGDPTAPPLDPTAPPTLLPTPQPIPVVTTEPTPAPTQAETVSAQPSVAGDIDYFDEPMLKWFFSLPFTAGQIAKGNAVTLSPDDSLVYVTRSDGNLNVLLAGNGDPFWSYTPSRGENNWQIVCNSGVVFGERFTDGLAFAVYAIIDKAPFGDPLDSQSRIIAVSNPPEGEGVLWISDPIPGEVQGTPVVTSGFVDGGKYIYITHNINLNDAVELNEEGIFSILSADDGSLVFTETFSVANPGAAAPLPYAPMGTTPFPFYGKYDGGASNAGDIVVWGTNGEDGFSRTGQNTAFQYTVPLATVFLRTSRWSTVTRPALTRDGLSLFMTIRGSQLRAWVGDRSFQAGASWDAQLATDPTRPATPIQNAPVLSNDETLIFTSSASTTFACIEAETGSVVWEVDSTSLYTSEAKVSPEDRFVYNIQQDGKVEALRQTDGSLIWSTDCATLGGQCLGSASGALGEFTLSQDGLNLIYGDVNGNILSLQLGSTTVPTSSPTDAPTTAEPSTMPSALPTTEETEGTEMPSMAPTLAATAATPQPTPAPFFTPFPTPLVPFPTPTLPFPTPTTLPTEPSWGHRTNLAPIVAAAVVGIGVLFI